MADTILVVVEQREGKLNRVSWETITAGQAIAAATGWPLEAAVVGSGVNSIAGEIAGKKVEKVYDLESPQLEPYSPDAFASALKQFLESKQPKLVFRALVQAATVELGQMCDQGCGHLTIAPGQTRDFGDQRADLASTTEDEHVHGEQR